MSLVYSVFLMQTPMRTSVQNVARGAALHIATAVAVTDLPTLPNVKVAVLDADSHIAIGMSVNQVWSWFIHHSRCYCCWFTEHHKRASRCAWCWFTHCSHCDVHSFLIRKQRKWVREKVHDPSQTAPTNEPRRPIKSFKIYTFLTRKQGKVGYVYLCWVGGSWR